MFLLFLILYDKMEMLRKFNSIPIAFGFIDFLVTYKKLNKTRVYF